MAANRDPFEVLTEKWTPELRKAFLDAVYEIRGRVNVDLIARLLKDGQIDQAVRAVGLDPLDFRALDQALTGTFNMGGSLFGDTIPAIRNAAGAVIKFQFDVRNLRAEQWTREKSSTLITEIINDQKVAIRNHLVAGLEAGKNPRTTALELVGRRNPTTGTRDGGVIGLTSGQEGWQRRYSDELASSNPADLKAALGRGLRDKRFDGAINKAIRTGEPIPAETQAKMRLAYRNKSLKYRADVISRNETIRALGASQHEAYSQAIDKGIVKAETITRFWVTAGDERVRHTHRLIPGMNKDGVGWQEAFKTPTGPTMHAPHSVDVMCRCRERIEIDRFAGFRRG